MNGQINAAIRRGRGYWFVDGFIEMLAGGLFVLLGGVLLLRGMAPQGSFLAQFASIAGDIGLIKVFGLLAAGLIVWWLKDHFTYPRTGFVRGKRVTWLQLLTFLRNAALCLLLPLLALAAAVFFLPSVSPLLFSMPAWSPVLMSAIWAALCILAGRWLGLRRFVLLGGLILLLGAGIGAWQLAAGLPRIPAEALQSSSLAAIPIASLSETLNRVFVSIGWLTLGSGVVFAASGVITFLRYRKENPAPYKEQA